MSSRGVTSVPISTPKPGSGVKTERGSLKDLGSLTPLLVDLYVS